MICLTNEVKGIEIWTEDSDELLTEIQQREELNEIECAYTCFHKDRLELGFCAPEMEVVGHEDYIIISD